MGFSKQNNKEDSKFKIGDHVRISKLKKHFWKRLLPNWSFQRRFYD